MISVLIADDHPIVRKGLKTILKDVPELKSETAYLQQRYAVPPRIPFERETQVQLLKHNYMDNGAW